MSKCNRRATVSKSLYDGLRYEVRLRGSCLLCFDQRAGEGADINVVVRMTCNRVFILQPAAANRMM
jgi:hypothetical protein